jgi:hypothetical protein
MPEYDFGDLAWETFQWSDLGLTNNVCTSPNLRPQGFSAYSEPAVSSRNVRFSASKNFADNGKYQTIRYSSAISMYITTLLMIKRYTEGCWRSGVLWLPKLAPYKYLVRGTTKW